MAAAVSLKQEADGQEAIIEKLVEVRRVAKTVKGGRNMRFAALVVVGDGKGRVGYGTGKAREVPEAIRKASEEARKTMMRVPLRNGKTLHHDTIGRFGAAKVVLRAAPPGTGIIAGGPMRAVFEALGVQDIVGKSVGTSNPNNMVKATFDAFEMFESPRHVGSRRSKKVSDVIVRTADQEKQAQREAEIEAQEKAAEEKRKAKAAKEAAAAGAKGKDAKKEDKKSSAKAKPKAKKPAAKKEDAKADSKAKADDTKKDDKKE